MEGIESIYKNFKQCEFGIPDDAGVYIVQRLLRPNATENKNDIKINLYVGSSANINKRLSNANHIYRQIYDSTTYWNDYEKSLCVISYYLTKNYLEVERLMIDYLKPHYNIQHNKIQNNE